MTQIEFTGTFDLGYDDEERFEARVFGAAAQKLLADHQIGRLARDKVHEKIDEALGDLILERVNALLDKEIPQTNRFGETTGDPKPFRELFADRAEEYLTETVDSSGRKVKPTNFGGATPRLAYLLKEVGAREFEAEARKVANEVKEGLQKRAREAVAKVAAEAIKIR